MTADYDTTAARPGCPDCGQDLSVEGELLRCERHGSFFAYGPRLLVRTPQAHSKQPRPLLPWETLDDIACVPSGELGLRRQEVSGSLRGLIPR